MYNQKIWIFFICLAATFSAVAQDIHYSQFSASPLNINPALTGVFQGDMRIGGNYRSQWTSVPVSYRQFTGFADKRFTRKDDNKSLTPWAGGLLFNYDRAGDSRLHMAQLGLNGAYLLGLGERSGINIGANLSAIQRAFRLEDLFFDDQYRDKDPLEPTQENISNQSKLFPSLGLGANYLFRDDDSRTSLDVGVGAFHLNRPERNFWDQEANKMPIRYSVSAMLNLELVRLLDLRLEALHQVQGPHSETVLSAGLPIHINENDIDGVALQPGLKYRFNKQFEANDALIPFLMLNYKQWQAGVSYDINTSQFTEATNGRGGWEWSLIYIFAEPREPGYCPLCPTSL